MALRLRYNDKSIVLASGQLVVGRSVECNLVVNDPLASRRHAVLTVSKTGAFIADLGSKAGVLVNGVPIAGARRLASGDTIQLASERIDVEDVNGGDDATDPRLRTTLSPPAFSTVPAAFRLAPTPPLGIARVERLGAGGETIDEEAFDVDLARTAEAPRVAVPAGAPRDLRQPPASSGSPDSGRRTESERKTHPAPDSSPKTPRSQTREDDQTAPKVAKPPPLPTFPRAQPVTTGPNLSANTRGSGSPSASAAPNPNALRALAAVAEKALAMNRTQEAERVLQRTLHDVLDAAGRGEIDAQAAELAASLGAKLAASLGAGRWFDYAVEIYAVQGDLMPAPVVDLLLEAVRKAKPIDKQAFREYLADAREAAGDSPARRFVIHRLEGVQRIMDLK